MSTLFERITNPAFDPIVISDRKIAIYAIRGLLKELVAGFVTLNDISAELALSPDQTADLFQLAGEILSSSDIDGFFDMLFTFWTLSEAGVIPIIYRDELVFWDRVNNYG